MNRKRRLALGLLLGIGFAGGIAIMLFVPQMQDRRWIADETLRARVDSAIALHHALQPFALAVAVDDGTVRLHGSVDDPIERELAGRLAASVDGVRGVDNRLQVEPDRARWLGQHSAMVGSGADDRALALAVRAQLRWNRTTRALALQVDSHGGEIRLRGHARTLNERDTAGRIAARIEGVQAVDNRIEVDEAQPAPTGGAFAAALVDAWLTARVKSALLFTAGVSGLDLKVSTRGGEVALSGSATSRTELELAVEIASSVKGVRRIDCSQVQLGS
jgi:osmotically-inducible protein OsmY